MALHGTIRDFGLGEIFQLIGMQRKTGVLTLENGEDTVTIKFVDGHVVAADTRRRSVEELLGAVLVRTGRVTELQLQDALRIQRRTLRRLGHVLVEQRLISGDELVEALRTQSLQIVYRLFRWRNGTYHFRTEERVEYDDRHFTPIGADTILMEGARMVDEWPIIERRIKSDRMVFRRARAAEALHLSVESIVDRDVDVELGFGDGAARRHDAAAVRLSSEEREVLAFVDGSRTVAEICERASLGEFDTCRVLAELVTRNLIQEVRRATPVAGMAGRRWVRSAVQWSLCAAVLAAAAVGLAAPGRSAYAPWALARSGDAAADLRRAATQARLERIERALHIYYLDTGEFPRELELLAAGGQLDPRDLVDPGGRAFGYELGAGGYRVFGWDPAGQPDPALALSHRFSGLQRMLAAPGTRSAASATNR